MMHIEFPDGKRPHKEWLEKAASLTCQLIKAPNKAARDKIIDANSQVWGEIKEWLETFSYGKCWFSEARDTFSHWQVEHFRPKKEAKEPDRDGYWWRAFDYLNYRLCGNVGNAKKGSYFPLRPQSMAASCPEDNCDDEAPLLIDPTVAADVMLLTFANGGRAVPAVPIEQDPWHYERAKVSIERYKLNDHPPLLRARASIWNACQVDFKELKALLVDQAKHHSPTRAERIRSIAGRLIKRGQPGSEFSSVARAFLRQCPEGWAKNLT
jgi:hypothetical protein